MTEEGLVVETTVPPAPSATYAASGHGQFGRTQAERYLARFGYLQVDPETSPDAETYVSEALRSFQVAHGLPETGKLDEQTSALMERPRCGVPNRASLRAFIPQGSQWNKYTLRYALGELTPDLSGDEVRDACVQAFALWSDVTHLRFVEV